MKRLGRRFIFPKKPTAASIRFTALFQGCFDVCRQRAEYLGVSVMTAKHYGHREKIPVVRVPPLLPLLKTREQLGETRGAHRKVWLTG